MVAGDVLFKSKIDAKSKAKAKSELGEDEKDRRGAVQSFRNLIKQQNVIRTPTGTFKFNYVTRKSVV